MTTNIRITKKTHQELTHLKNEMRAKNLDEVIQMLLTSHKRIMTAKQVMVIE